MDDDFVEESPPDEREEAAEWVASKMTPYLLESLEGFSRRTLSGLEAAFSARHKELNKFFEDRFDEHYTRQLLERIPQDGG